MTSDSEDGQRTLWRDQDDPTDTGVEVDSDYLHTESRKERAADCYNPGAEALTDGGQPVERRCGDGNGEHFKESDALTERGDKGLTHTPARTLVCGFPENDRRWRLHEDLKVSVQREDGTWYTAPHKDTDKRAEACLFDAKLQALGLSAGGQGAVRRLVATEKDESRPKWNIKLSGKDSMLVGYAAWWLNPQNPEDAEAFAAAVGAEVGLSAEEAREAARYAFKRAEERGLLANERGRSSVDGERERAL